ncbi:hypothetical protein B0I00_1914 [Novosphingobium kunmingense]|uniref:PilZ domain-containing protein n=1 Tax=Novosphingobium kunmingense TaxID=1211806 RepID=A0A2N0HL49_9SPHN|nr:hypothetical protein B0I00_1914 [Novosphingobium kunmingense]
MNEPENRGALRSSLLLTGELQTEGGITHCFKVRNVSATGLMGEMEPALTIGDRVSLRLGDTVRVTATVAWSAPPRFGLSFELGIDPASVRRPLDYEPRPFAARPAGPRKRFL